MGEQADGFGAHELRSVLDPRQPPAPAPQRRRWLRCVSHCQRLVNIALKAPHLEPLAAEIPDFARPEWYGRIVPVAHFSEDSSNNRASRVYRYILEKQLLT